VSVWEKGTSDNKQTEKLKMNPSLPQTRREDEQESLRFIPRDDDDDDEW
jgi:hypothetical protein